MPPTPQVSFRTDEQTIEALRAIADRARGIHTASHHDIARAIVRLTVAPIIEARGATKRKAIHDLLARLESAREVER